MTESTATCQHTSHRRWLNGLLGTVRHAITSRLSDRQYVALVYRREFGYWPHLKQPRTFNEKICRRRIDPEPAFTPLSDKVQVRDYVKAVVGEQYLIPCHGVCKHVDEAFWDTLPERFVMKANHGSGFNLLVRERRDYPPQLLNALGRQWLDDDFHATSRERHYRGIDPQLMFEQLLLDERGRVPKDYKFYCFRRQGEAPRVFIEIDHDRFENLAFDYYDSDWNLVDIVEERFTTGVPMPRPAMLDEAMAVALKLSEGFGFVRIDLYLTDDRVYFGEMTFTPTGGMKHFRSHEQDLAWGQLFEELEAPAEQLPASARGLSRAEYRGV
ncbi:teichuronopeptide biosynthesis TupA-like protein [Kushneria sinocarnis]|uniref:Teichuronopeptide biosynthesis TupA-like protein n=1 Tax=Kushneria sinocarnis TaxID=595502 RepID=A0A420X0Y9_9GAMM|nr:ATP-grasp fold amidoligase family protein [Kushneria sinocarnis]RKR07513.1 teichuronopeptide biosynthesis TupA-like protein [Kushneria sinocarnis]